jgi:hypothetical protein
VAILARCTTKASTRSSRELTASGHPLDSVPLRLQFIIALTTYAINERMARRLDELIDALSSLDEWHLRQLLREQFAQSPDGRCASY